MHQQHYGATAQWAGHREQDTGRSVLVAVAAVTGVVALMMAVSSTTPSTSEVAMWAAPATSTSIATGRLPTAVGSVRPVGAARPYTQSSTAAQATSHSASAYATATPAAVAFVPQPATIGAFAAVFGLAASAFHYATAPARKPLALSAGGAGSAAPALLLDCDGTIVDTERDGHRVAFNQAFAQKGLDFEWSVEMYGDLLTTGGGKERMTRYFNDYNPGAWPDKETPPSPDHPLIMDLHKLKTRLFMDIIESGSLPLRPGILAIVDEAIAAGWTLAVCSTSNEKAVQAVVDKLLDSKIKHIYAGDMVKAKKPDPAIYNMAAEDLGLDPSKCVVLEDSHIGLMAARAAGMACIVTKSTYTGEEDFTGAQLVVDDLGSTGLGQASALI